MRTLNLSDNTVHHWRKNGYKLRIFHYRHVVKDNGELEKFVPLNKIADCSKCYSKGGRTHINVTAPDGENYIGEATCYIKDSFSYKNGVKIALGRLQKYQGHSI